jgi:hypothetical protein
VAAACLAVAAVLLGGCGSSGRSNADETPTTGGEGKETTPVATGPLTKAQFIKEATRICHQGLRKKDTALSAVTELPAPTKAKAREAAANIVVLAILKVYGEIIEQLAELSPPKEDEAGARLIVQKYEAAMQSAEQDPRGASDENPFVAGDRAAEAYGIRSCIL